MEVFVQTVKYESTLSQFLNMNLYCKEIEHVQRNFFAVGKWTDRCFNDIHLSICP